MSVREVRSHLISNPVKIKSGGRARFGSWVTCYDWWLRTAA
ncbi:hypothetical protein [Gloeocapsopsis dulcis]|nr:hypothetical protein [Gloeocapsopsis dulcis]WNN88748.1 hypothetical protein P0S91_21140 [Gloeocapsopsis dulcis]